jgi:hypothetical protein
MKSLMQIISLIEDKKYILEENFFVSKIGVFGSYSRNSASSGSDIDIIVEFSKSVDIFHFLKLEEFLSNLLTIKVDLVTFNALRKEIKNEILSDVVYA